MLRAAVLATCVLGALLFLRSRHAVVHAPARPGRAGSEWRPAVSSFAATTRRDPVPQPVADLLHSLDAARPAAAATPAAHAFASPRIGCARGGRRPTGPRPASGWKRTLSPEVYARAEFFGHERTLPEVFCDVGIGGVVWLSFSNTAFSELALNWISHVYRLRKERQFAMAALDAPFQRLLLGEGVPYFAFDHGVLGDMRSNVSGFRRLGALKGELVLRVLRAGRHVLLSDVRRAPFGGRPRPCLDPRRRALPSAGGRGLAAGPGAAPPLARRRRRDERHRLPLAHGGRAQGAAPAGRDALRLQPGQRRRPRRLQHRRASASALAPRPGHPH